MAGYQEPAPRSHTPWIWRVANTPYILPSPGWVSVPNLVALLQMVWVCIKAGRKYRLWSSAELEMWSKVEPC